MYVCMYVWVYQCIPLVSFLIVLNVCALYIVTWNIMLQSLKTMLLWWKYMSRFTEDYVHSMYLGLATQILWIFFSPLYFWLTFLLYWNLHVLLHNILFFTHVCFLFIVLITWIVCLSWKFLHFLFIFVVYLSSSSLSRICYLIEKTFIKGQVIISTPISSCLGWPPPIFSLIWIITNLSHKAFFMVPFHVWTVDRILY